MTKSTTAGPHRPQQNTLLAALPGAVYDRLAGELELVPLRLGQVLHEANETMSHAYFPLDCVVSLLYVMDSGESAEIAVVGKEGMIPVGMFMGGGSTTTRAIVQNAGHAYRVKAKTLKDEFDSGRGLSRLLLRFASVLMMQMVQTAACNRHHPVDQQLCRWILLTLDRLPSDQMTMTEDLVAKMLGLTPDDVQCVVKELVAEGLIDYDRGEILLLDRKGVEERVCECYGVVKKETDRQLPFVVEAGQ